MISTTKITVINRYTYPVIAGIETVIMETFSRLVKRGYSVTVHASRNTLTQWNILSASDTINGMQIKRYPYSHFGFFPKVDWENTNTVFLMNFDIFPHIFILLYCGLLKILGKKKFMLILAPHGGYTPEWEIFSPLARFIKQTYHLTLGKFLISTIVDGVQSISEWEKQEMISYGINKNRIHVIGNGLENIAFEDNRKHVSKTSQARVKEYGNYIIQLGRIHPIKNQELAIRAMQYIPEQIKLVLAGPVMDAGYMNKLERVVKELHLKKRIIFAGTVTGYDKYFLLRNAKLMIHMALWENQPIAVFEGISQGLSALVADNSGLHDAIIPGKTGIRLTTTDPEKLAEEIMNLYHHTPRIHPGKLQRSGYLQSWDNVIDKLVLFMKQSSVNI